MVYKARSEGSIPDDISVLEWRRRRSRWEFVGAVFILSTTNASLPLNPETLLKSY